MSMIKLCSSDLLILFAPRKSVIANIPKLSIIVRSHNHCRLPLAPPLLIVYLFPALVPLDNEVNAVLLSKIN